MMLQHVDDRSDHSSSQLTAITRSETLERAFNGPFEQGAMGKFTEDALHEEESRHYGEANVRQEVMVGKRSPRGSRRPHMAREIQGSYPNQILCLSHTVLFWCSVDKL